ncbi:unnamed protein product, partial [Allacma fusca]
KGISNLTQPSIWFWLHAISHKRGWLGDSGSDCDIRT